MLLDVALSEEPEELGRIGEVVPVETGRGLPVMILLLLFV